MMYKIITPIATEPVTLAEVKQQLRLDSTDFADNIVSVQSIAPGTHVIAPSLVGTAVDVLGYSAVILFESGTNASGGKVDVSVQESDNGTDYTTWSTFTQVTESNDNATYEKSYTGNKQYIRVVATITTASCDFGVSIVKSYSTSTEDTLLLSFITAAREHGEDATGRAFATQTIELMLDEWNDSIELPMPPLQSITSIKYKDSVAVESTLAATEYVVDTDSNIGKIVPAYGKTYPTFTAYPVNPIRIRSVVGYTSLPQIFKNAMLVHIGFMYKYRDVGIPDSDMKTVDSIYRSRKAWWF